MRLQEIVLLDIILQYFRTFSYYISQQDLPFAALNRHLNTYMFKKWKGENLQVQLQESYSKNMRPMWHP